MSTAAFLFVVTLVNTLITSISGSFQSCITCPCGSSNQTYTHCLSELILRNATCERWFHCQTCKANTTFCITCRPGHFGPTCVENKNIRRKRQDDPDLLNPANNPRQSGSDRNSQARCVNHGPVPHGRVLVIPPFDDIQDDDDFDFPYGTILKFICDEGYVLEGQDTSRCSSNSYWTEEIPKCVRAKTPAPQQSCKHPGVDVNGRINNPLADSQGRQQVFPAGTELTFVCNDGFEPEGATILACLSNGRWTSLPPNCRRSNSTEASPTYCKHPGIIENGIIEDVVSESEQFPIGTELRYLCIEGYQIEGTAAIHCLHNLSWSDSPPICRIQSYRESPYTSQLSCKHPGTIENGFIVDDEPETQSLPLGSTLTFQCNEGYEIVGSYEIYCLQDFYAPPYWSDVPPFCRYAAAAARRMFRW